MNYIRNGWFSEMSDFIPGHCLSLKVQEVLCQMKTNYQNLLIFKSTNHGRVMVLDGMIQLTERDEFMYQEMISMLPLACHSHPESVLIIGGGDGGVARDVLKHPSVKKIIQCELDEDVILMSRKYLPFTAKSYDNEKVTIVIENGIDYLTEHTSEFDVIITDSTDPVGPGEQLFQSDYFNKIYKALKPNGVMCSQGEGMWMEKSIVTELVQTCRNIFPVVQYAYGSIPTYPTGQIGYLLCSKNKGMDFSKPSFDISPIQEQFRYYTPEIHSAAFILPHTIKKTINE